MFLVWRKVLKKGDRLVDENKLDTKRFLIQILKYFAGSYCRNIVWGLKRTRL